MSYRRHYQQRAKHPPKIEIAPFVDVVLVLLIIFMLTAPFTLGGVDVTLPDGNEKITAPADEKIITITYAAGNKIHVDDAEVGFGRVLQTVRQKTNGNTDYPLYIKSDKTVLYGDVMALIDSLNKSGYKKTILVTQNN